MPADTQASLKTGTASLRLRFSLFAIITLAISLGLVGLALDSAYQRSSESDLRQQMETWVYLVLAAAEVDEVGNLSLSADLGDPLLGQPGSGVYAHVHGDAVHRSSPSVLGIELPELASLPPGETLFSVPAEANRYYTYQFGLAWELADQSVVPFTINILVDPVRLQPQISEFRAGLWRSLGGAGLILLLAQVMFTALALRPLQRVAEDVGRVESGQSETLDGPYPSELEPLTRNVNRLLTTEKANQEHYRGALDSLAHSLKTPLAVMKANLTGEREPDRVTLEGAVDDMEQLVTTRLKRASASTRRTLVAPTTVLPVIERLVRSLTKVHSHVLKKLDVRIDAELQFYGEERDLLEVAGNLLDNACKYGDGVVCITGGAIEPERSRPGLWLQVDNDGKAVPQQTLENLLQRGVRGDERVEGHGLGLNIVSEVVSAYGGSIEFAGSELGGVSVRISIPPA